MSALQLLALLMIAGAYASGVEFTIRTIERDAVLAPRWIRANRWARFGTAVLWPITLGVLCLSSKERGHG